MMLKMCMKCARERERVSGRGPISVSGLGVGSKVKYILLAK